MDRRQRRLRDLRRPGGERRARLSEYERALTLRLGAPWPALGVRHERRARLVQAPFEQTPQTPAVEDGVAYVATSGVWSETIGQDGVLAALAADGTERWRFDPEAGLRTPVVADGTVYTGPFRASGAPLVAFDADSGDELWRRDRVVSDPELAVADETLYLAGGSKVVALRD
ncbi:PQQ-binding-like beta-propeller repeat protein [Haloarchaeobius sp. FL176]|uniref:outer membrane protein assembly factor BamB family protein n=1 Tax=Haloarchaeobius sp. FL176 TaxID=2967129 RepID=UPI0034E965DA